MKKDFVMFLLLASISLNASAVLPVDFYQTEAGKIFSALLSRDKKQFDNGGKAIFRWSKDMDENMLMSKALSGKRSVEIYSIYSVINNHPETFSFDNFSQHKSKKSEVLKNFSNYLAGDASTLCEQYAKDSQSFSMPSISSDECNLRVSHFYQKIAQASKVNNAQ
ncbi:hypothetical protein EYY94_13145 [Obesumbacterium proteus]|uniref:hypothetical protein n=1 Tax=Obesumbacterium proteus TaxID=82983 RepID=UPI00103323D2|nr:hypothetical protein [Obesumbacterium proteus]TBL74414.1 hypothetical protein EYY94_13145 [Obesumbacterium proteus]